MKKLKISLYLLLLSCQALASHLPDFADTTRDKYSLITELTAMRDFEAIAQYQAKKFLTIAAVEFVVIIVLTVLLLRKRPKK